MMDWTDRHCRYFHRLMTKNALLYTEMVVDNALIHGDVERHLGFLDTEHPVALQLGGSNPVALAQAAAIGASWGYDEINLNVGCPSDRVKSGTFGACLMRQPNLVGDCVRAITEIIDLPVSVKCRIGVDEQDSETALTAIADATFENGGQALWVHARKAWLEGLSPKQNRDVPPLDYDRVFRLKQDYPDRFIGINGGISNIKQALEHLEQVDGVMLGRAAYHTPDVLRQVDRDIFGNLNMPISFEELCEKMMRYTQNHIDQGGRANHVTRHLLGLFHGLPGARKYRRILTVEACKPGANSSVIEQAFSAVFFEKPLAHAISA